MSALAFAKLGSLFSKGALFLPGMLPGLLTAGTSAYGIHQASNILEDPINLAIVAGVAGVVLVVLLKR